MKLINEEEITIKKSRFIAYLYDIQNKEEIPFILESIKKEHKGAKHYPYAYILNNTAGKSDDHEPSGTAGLPIYNVLERNKQVNRLIVVIRYYGGIKLGTGGLLRAYSTVASNTLKKCP